jgi:hypothetical protein
MATLRTPNHENPETMNTETQVPVFLFTDLPNLLLFVFPRQIANWKIVVHRGKSLGYQRNNCREWSMKQALLYIGASPLGTSATTAENGQWNKQPNVHVFVLNAHPVTDLNLQ